MCLAHILTPLPCQTSIGQAFAQSALLRSLGAFLISPVARTSALSSPNHFEYHGIGSLRSKSCAAPEMLRGMRLIFGVVSHLSCRERGGSGGLSSPQHRRSCNFGQSRHTKLQEDPLPQSLLFPWGSDFGCGIRISGSLGSAHFTATFQHSHRTVQDVQVEGLSETSRVQPRSAGFGRVRRSSERLGGFGRDRRDSAEFGGVWRVLLKFGGAGRRPAEIGGVRQSLAEFGGVWRSLAEFGGIRRSSEEFGGVRRSSAEFGGVRRNSAEFGGFWRSSADSARNTAEQPKFGGVRQSKKNMIQKY